MASNKLKNNKAMKEETKSKKPNNKIKQMKSSSKNLLGEHNLKNHRSAPIKQKECCSKKQILFVKECLSR